MINSNNIIYQSIKLSENVELTVSHHTDTPSSPPH